MSEFTGPRPAIEKLLNESLRWSRDHKGTKYRHSIQCEWCFQQGLLSALVALRDDGTTVQGLRTKYTEKVNREPRQKMIRKVRRRQVVVRRKK